MSAIRFVKSTGLSGCSSGATAIEYALVASLISVVIVTVVAVVGEDLTGLFEQVSAGFG